VGKTLRDLESSHLALQADALLEEDVLQGFYGKEPERQVCMNLKGLQLTSQPWHVSLALRDSKPDVYGVLNSFYSLEPAFVWFLAMVASCSVKTGV